MLNADHGIHRSRSPGSMKLGVLAVVAATTCGLGGCPQAGSPTCFQGNLVIDRTDELNVLASATCIEGNLILDSIPVDVLDASFLRRVDGDLHLINTPINFVSLPALTEVGGSVVIRGNTEISFVQAPLLVDIQDALVVSDNARLSQIGFPALETTGDAVTLVSNVALVEADLSSLSVVGGSYSVIDHPILLTLSTSSLVEVAGTLSVTRAPLVELDLSQLRAVERAIVFDNLELLALEFDALDVVGGALRLISLPLRRVSIGGDATFSEIEFLALPGLDSLSFLRDHLVETPTNLVLSGVNADRRWTAFQDVTSVDNLVFAGMNPTTIDLSSLETVDVGLRIQYSGSGDIDLRRLRHVEGNLSVDSVSNLDLSALESVTGQLQFYGSPSLGTLDWVSLPQLRTVEGFLYVTPHPPAGFPALETIGGMTIARDPPRQADSFPSLVTVTNGLTWSGSMPATVDLPELTTIGSLSLNNGVRSFSAPKLVSAVTLQFSQNTTLSTFDAPALESIGNLSSYNAVVPALPFVEELDSLVVYVDLPRAIDFVPNLRRVEGQLVMQGMITSVELPLLEEVGADFDVSYADTLEELQLPLLRTVGGQLRFIRLALLRTLGLDAIETATSFSAYSAENLPRCEVEAIAAVLIANGMDETATYFDGLDDEALCATP